MERKYPKDILIVGDSLTQLKGYAEVFEKELTGEYTVHHYGHGGSGTLGIAAMQGGIPVFCEPVTIPENTEKTEIVPITACHDRIGIGGQSLEGLNPCTIGGIEGTYTWCEGHAYFERSSVGKAATITRPERIRFAANGETGKTLVVWAGTNDSYHQTDARALTASLCDIIDSMIRHNGTDSYIVMGLTAKAYCPVVEEVNRILSCHYGEHFLDVRTYMLCYGIDDAGIKRTDADFQCEVLGEMPISLRTDCVHFNYTGFTVIGKLLYRFGKDLGYWE